MDAENFVKSNPILRWFILPLLFSLLCISDFVYAQGLGSTAPKSSSSAPKSSSSGIAPIPAADAPSAKNTLDPDPINLDAEIMFRKVCGNQRWGNTPASFDNPHWVKCNGEICNFWGWIDIPFDENVALEAASTTWFFTKKTNKIQGYNFNKTIAPDVVGEKFVEILKALTKKYGKPTNVNESNQEFFVWFFDKTGAVGAPVNIGSMTVIWDFPRIKCIAKLEYDKITYMEMNKVEVK